MNNPQHPRSERLRREKMLFQYTSALERGDFEAITNILSAAEDDTELARMIAEMNQAAAAHQEAEFKTGTKSRRRLPAMALVSAVASIVIVFGAASLLSMARGGIGASPDGGIDEGSATPQVVPTQALAMTATAPMMLPSMTAAATSGIPQVTQGPDQGSPIAPDEPMIIKNGDLTMIVRSVSTAIDQVTLIASDNGGYVLSNQSRSTNGRDSATMTIAVRADQFDDAMRELRDIAMEVLQENSSGQDVSTEYVDLQSRLRNLEATRDRIKSFLDETENVNEALEVSHQLSEIEAQIEQVKGRMTYLSGRTAFSTITVNMEEYVPSEPTETPMPTPRWSLGPRVDEAVGAQRDLIRGGLEALVWLMIVPGPYVLVGLIGWALIRMVLKRTE